MSVRVGALIPSAFVLLTAALGSGCAANDISLSITEFIPPDSSAAAGTCSYVSTGMTVLSQGFYDLSLAQYSPVGYNLGFVLQSNLKEIDTEPVEQQAYYVQSYDVELEVHGAAANVIPESRRVFNIPTGTTRIAPGEVIAASATVIAPDLGVALAKLASDPPGDIIVHIRAVTTRADEEQETAFSTFPIEICVGCLTGNHSLKIPKCYLDVKTPLAGDPCNVAQDLPANCCLKTNTAANTETLACGADAIMTTTN